ncbi:hypothetical protein HDU89_000892 [Geranomyces variabilis]|nr:hypothetical protein HDU89_000892 [Geranomyces variabilis]
MYARELSLTSGLKSILNLCFHQRGNPLPVATNAFTRNFAKIQVDVDIAQQRLMDNTVAELVVDCENNTVTDFFHKGVNSSFSIGEKFFRRGDPIFKSGAVYTLDFMPGLIGGRYATIIGTGCSIATHVFGNRSSTAALYVIAAPVIGTGCGTRRGVAAQCCSPALLFGTGCGKGCGIAAQVLGNAGLCGTCAAVV